MAGLDLEALERQANRVLMINELGHDTHEDQHNIIALVGRVRDLERRVELGSMLLREQIDKTCAANLRLIEVERAGGSEQVRTLDDYHDDNGPVVWFCWDSERNDWLSEPAWVGQPDDSDWPGYHTHWVPHPKFPAAIATPRADSAVSQADEEIEALFEGRAENTAVISANSAVNSENSDAPSA